MVSVSVVIPTFNRVVLLRRALDSVLAQTLPASEIIVVDDGSTDNTAWTIQSRYPEVNLIQQSNRGVSAARNTGILAAKLDWIALLDSDDVWHEHKLARQMQALQHAPDALICHSNEQWYRNGQRLYPRGKHKKAGGHIFKHCLPLCVISPSTVVIHRSLFDEIGLFDQDLPACEDYDLWLRICSRYPVLYVDEALIAKYGGHGGQLSRKFWGMDRFRIRALSKIIADPTLGDSDRDAAIDMMIKKINIYLSGAKKRGNTAHVYDFERLLKSYTTGYGVPAH